MSAALRSAESVFMLRIMQSAPALLIRYLQSCAVSLNFRFE
jgi:hypothetical protein